MWLILRILYCYYIVDSAETSRCRDSDCLYRLAKLRLYKGRRQNSLSLVKMSKMKCFQLKNSRKTALERALLYYLK